MPFAVIETVNNSGVQELSVVPNKWLRSSKNGNIVLWPNTESTSELAKYFSDENSCPQKTWLKYKCTVKRYPISSYEHAMSVLEVMSGESSSDVSHIRKRKQNDIETDALQKKLSLENTSRLLRDEANRESSTKGNTDISPSTSGNVVLAPNDVVPQASPLVTIKEENDSYPVIISAYSEANSETIQYARNDVSNDVHKPILPSDTDNPIRKCLDKMNEIIGLQHRINLRLDQLEKRVTDISAQNDLILDATRNCCNRSSKIEEALSFTFDPMEDEQQLAELEKNLEVDTFKSKMIKWLRVNVSGDCTDDRMLGVLDLLFTKKFQTKCTWTGISRKGPKTAIMPNRNILEIFQIIGSNDSEVVNQRELANFFMKKLKNSLKRLTITGVRRATRHVRRRKPKKQQTDECNNSDDSSSHSEAEPEADTGSIDSGSSDGNDRQRNALCSSNVPSTSEYDHDAFFIVKIE